MLENYFSIILVIFAIHLIGLNSLECSFYMKNSGEIIIDQNVTCIDALADHSTKFMNTFFKNFTDKVTIGEYKCLTVAFGDSKPRMWYKGCAYNIQPRNLKFQDVFSTTVLDHYKVCSEDLCNINHLSVVSSFLVFLVKFFNYVI